MARNEVERYTPRTQELLAPTEHLGGGQLGQHAAADALVTRLLTLPVRNYRDHDAVQKRIRLLALSGGKQLFYAWPVKNKGTGKTSIVKGPSIVCAELVANMAGNCGYCTSTTLLPDAYLISAFFVDRESGNVIMRQFQQRRNQMQKMGDDAARQEDISFQIGQSKAIRNVITRGLPELTDYAVAEAERALLATVQKDPKKIRERIMASLADLGVPAERVIAWVGRGMGRWDEEDLVKISAALVAVNEKTATTDEIWPDPNLSRGPPPPPADKNRKGSGKKPNEDPAGEPGDDASAGEDPKDGESQ